MNLYDMCRYVIEPATKLMEISMVELMAEKEQTPDYFVSHVIRRVYTCATSDCLCCSGGARAYFNSWAACTSTPRTGCSEARQG